MKFLTIRLISKSTTISNPKNYITPKYILNAEEKSLHKQCSIGIYERAANIV